MLLFLSVNQSEHERKRKRENSHFNLFNAIIQSRLITECRMASSISLFCHSLSNMSTTLKAKRRCPTSFLITDILAHSTRSSNPMKIPLESEDEGILHESDENGK